MGDNGTSPVCSASPGVRKRRLESGLGPTRKKKGVGVGCRQGAMRRKHFLRLWCSGHCSVRNASKSQCFSRYGGCLPLGNGFILNVFSTHFRCPKSTQTVTRRRNPPEREENRHWTDPQENPWHAQTSGFSGAGGATNIACATHEVRKLLLNSWDLCIYGKKGEGINLLMTNGGDAHGQKTFGNVCSDRGGSSLGGDDVH